MEENLKTKRVYKKKTVSENEKETTVKKTQVRKEKSKEETILNEDVKIKKESVSPNAKKKKEKLKVLYCAGEVYPFVKTGGLADVAGALPIELNKNDIECKVVLPLYSKISQEYKEKMTFKGFVYVNLGWRNEYAGLFELKYLNTYFYFIDNERYFKRNNIYGEMDDGERFAFFSKACLEILQLINFYPDIIHANDWHTALVSVFLDTFYRNYDYTRNTKTVFTIHNIEFQGKYDSVVLKDLLGLDDLHQSLVEYKGLANYMKGAIESSNVVTTVSKTYANEILDPYFGYQLEDILNARSFKVKGIINGLDTSVFNPLTDELIYQKYDLDKIELKKVNKERLLDDLNMKKNDAPLIGLVSRLTHQKGLDLIIAGMSRIMQTNANIVILGSGEKEYENKLKEFEYNYPDRIRVVLGYDDTLAHKIYAASDLFLMPSKFEPCGLSQLIALRYGAVPIVREVGGLKDTITPYNHTTHEGLGFTFKTFNVEDFVYAVERAVGLYNDYKEDFNILKANGLKADFSWDKQALEYIKLYKEI